MEVDIPEAKLHGQARFFERVNKAIAPGDGMFQGHEHYFSVGASGLSAILDGMSATRLRPQNVRRVLDYACGYGRVLRWLRAAFPDAYLVGVDADRKAADAAANVLGVETRVLDTTLRAPLDAPFDLIWVGSLITHLPETETRRVLMYLREHLTSDGLLVFTTHGWLVEQRLETKTRTYNLDDAGVEEAVKSFRQSGYGYSDYGRMQGYGISVAAPSHIMSVIEACGLRPQYFKAEGWAAHQDVYGCIHQRKHI